MMKCLRYARYVVLGAGGIGLLLRLWLLQVGTDARGLYPAGHVSQILLLLMTLATLVFLLLTRSTGTGGHFASNFPKSVLTAAGNWVTALMLLWVNLPLLTDMSDVLGCIGGIFGLLAALALVIVGWHRLKGKQPGAPVHVLPCLYFLVLTFQMARQFGAEPELIRFLPQFLAVAASALAGYQLWGFDVGAGNRRKSLFWSFTAGYFSLVAIPGGGLLYGALAVWHLTGHCALHGQTIKVAEPDDQEPQVDMPPLTEENDL